MAKSYKVPFAFNGDKTTVPVALQPDGSVSYTQGFGPDYELDKLVDPINAKDVPRDQTNQLFFDVTESLGEVQQYGAALWSADMAPYPINARVYYDDKYWRSNTAGNSGEPGVAGWDDVSVFPQMSLPPRYISGFTLSNNGAAPATTIDVAAGTARNLLNTLDITLSAATSGVLQTTGAWTAGNGNNKLDAGARGNNQTYHVFAIRRTSDGAGDILFSLSPTAPTMPSGYAGFRRIGSVLTDGTSAIKAFIQDGDEFLLTNPVIDVSATGVAAGTLNYAISVPVGIVVKAIVQGTVQTSGGAAFYHINTPGNNDVSTNNCATAVTTGANLNAAFGRVYIRTNTSAQIQVNSQIGSNIHRFASYGWVDRRDA